MRSITRPVTAGLLAAALASGAGASAADLCEARPASLCVPVPYRHHVDRARRAAERAASDDAFGIADLDGDATDDRAGYSYGGYGPAPYVYNGIGYGYERF